MYSIGIARISKKFLWLTSLLCLIWSGMKNVKSSWKKSNFSSQNSMISVSASKSPQTSKVVPPSRFNPVNQPKIATIVPSDVSFYLASKKYTAGIFSTRTITSNAGSSKALPNVTVMVPDNRNSTENIKIFKAQRVLSNKTRKTSFEASGYAGSILPSKGSKNKDSINAESEKATKLEKTFTSSLKRNFKPTPSGTEKGLTETQFYDDKDKLSFYATKDPFINLGKKSSTKSPIYVRGKDFIGDKSIKFLPPPPQCMFKESSCKGRCGYQRQFGKKWTCFCDPECDSVFEDCCADFEEFCNVTSMLAQKMIETKFEKRWNCTELHGDDFPVWVIGQCHPEWDDAEVSRRCTEINTLIISELIPVIDQHNNTFLNRYCAICNNVTEFRQWEFEVFCDTIVPAGYTEAQWASFLDFFCLYDSFNLTQTWGRRYCVNVSSDCTYWHNKEIVEGCLWQGLTGLITDINSNIHYRNWDCFLCNTMGFSQALCGPSPPIVAPPLTPGVEFTMPFSSIFRMQSFLISQSKCPQDQIYDKIFQECKTFLARDRLNLGGILKRYAVILEYKEHAKSCGIPLFSGLDGTKLIARLNDVLQKLIEISLMERDSKFMNFKIYSLGNISFHVIFELLENSKETELLDSSIGYDLKLQNLAFHSRTFRRGVCRYSMNTSTVRKMLCSENGTFPLNEIQFTNKSVFITKTGKCYSYQEYLVLKNDKRLALCKDYWPGNCSHYIEVKKESNWSIFENGSVYTNETKGSWLHYGQYTIVDGVLRFCSSYPKAVFGSTTSIHEAILTHATTACLSISIISLTVLFIVYSRFPALRNLPGKNLMLFSVILALGQLLWLLQRYTASLSPRFCVGTTFALQYSVLASFSCSTSIAVHSLLTFHSIAKGSLTQSSSRKFYYYVLYSLGFPLIIVLTCLLLYYHNILKIVHYHPLCWFKDDLSVYIAFYIPALTMVFVNFIILSNTMKLLWNCSNERRNLAERNGTPTKMKIGIYLRMSTIMGATWLFGVFIVIFPDVVVFEYLFVFFNGLQGLYIALAFLFTDNVKKLIRSRRYDKGTTISQNTSRNKHSTTM